jgi:hypothetical protein
LKKNEGNCEKCQCNTCGHNPVLHAENTMMPDCNYCKPTKYINGYDIWNCRKGKRQCQYYEKGCFE